MYGWQWLVIVGTVVGRCLRVLRRPRARLPQQTLPPLHGQGHEPRLALTPGIGPPGSGLALADWPDFGITSTPVVAVKMQQLIKPLLESHRPHGRGASDSNGGLISHTQHDIVCCLRK